MTTEKKRRVVSPPLDVDPADPWLRLPEIDFGPEELVARVIDRKGRATMVTKPEEIAPMTIVSIDKLPQAGGGRLLGPISVLARTLNPGEAFFVQAENGLGLQILQSRLANRSRYILRLSGFKCKTRQDSERNGVWVYRPK